MEEIEDLGNKVRLIFELHLYNKEMSREEAISLVSTYFDHYLVLWNDKIGKREALAIDVFAPDKKKMREKILTIAERMALIRRIGIFINNENNSILNKFNWYVEFRGIENRKEALKYLMELGANLNLNSEKRIVIWKRKKEYQAYILIKEIKEKQFLDREPQNRPGFVPYTLKPRIARSLINIARIKEGKIIDPFCGVGGILIEASLLGLTPIGVDIKKENIRKSLENIDHFCKPNTAYFIVGNSISPYFFKKDKHHFDALITDLPYGRMSPKKGEIEELAKAIINYASLCRKGCRLIVMTNVKDFYNTIKKEDKRNILSLSKVFELQVRRTLTRYVFVFCNLCN